MQKWTKEQAKQYLVSYHMINSPNHHSINDVFERIKTIQYDPLNVVGSNPELVLQSRIKGFKKIDLFKSLYEDRTLIDGWDKQMSIYQTKYFPHYNRIRKERGIASIEGFKKYLDIDVNPYLDQVYEIIKEKGPIMSSQIKIGKSSGHKWFSGKPSNLAIDFLFHSGAIGIETRKNTQKKYNIIEKLIPEYLEVEPFTSEEEFILFYLYRRIEALGLTWNRSSVALSGLHIKSKNTRTKYFKMLTEHNLIEEVNIEGVNDVFYIPKIALDYPINITDKISFIAPLDNLIWDRLLVKTLFDFDYKWEVYVPKNKRVYGYYVLPLLHGSNLIGRIEFSNQRLDNPVEVIKIWYEPHIKNTKKLDNEINQALKKFAKYLGAKEVINNL